MFRQAMVGCILAVTFWCGAAAAATHPPDGLVVFVNASSASVSVSVDGGFLCTIAPGTRCTTVLTGDVAAQHTVSAQSGGNNWSDKIKISECHANYLGTKTFTFYNDEVPFSCEKQEASVAPSAPPPAAVAKPAPTTPVKAAAQSDLTACKTYSPDAKARIAACTRIIESPNPGIADLVQAHHNRCFARIDGGEKPAAVLPDCDRAVALDPKSFDAFNARALVYNIAGNLDASIADFTQAIAIDPKNASARYNRGQVYVRKKDLERSIADYTAYRDLSPALGEAAFRGLLCRARASLNVELETALSDCESAVRLKPKESYVYADRAFVRFRMGNLREARADIDKTIAQNNTNPFAFYVRALVNAREGNTMASYDDYAAAKKIQPGVAKQFDDMGLKLMVQPETAPFCPALTALIKAASERAASKAKADVAMPGATYCAAVERGYLCRWMTGEARASARQAAMATAAATCLTGYTRKDSAGNFGPTADFAQAKTKITVGATYDLKTSSLDGAAVAVTIAK